MKKITVLLLAMILVLTGCAKGEKSPEDSTVEVNIKTEYADTSEIPEPEDDKKEDVIKKASFVGCGDDGIDRAVTLQL